MLLLVVVSWSSAPMLYSCAFMKSTEVSLLGDGAFNSDAVGQADLFDILWFHSRICLASAGISLSFGLV